MTVFGITMVKDEADIIAASITRMAAQCDDVLVIDNGSTDGTRDLLDTLPCQVFDDPDRAYWQETKITGLAHLAADMGATWVVPFDADEVWQAKGGTLAEVLPGMRCHVARAVWVDYVPTAADQPGHPFQVMGYRRRRPNRLQKVAARTDPALTIAMGNHEAHYGRQVRHQRALVARHFPIRSPEQWISKIRNGWAALQLTDLPDDQGHHWRRYGKVLDAEGPDGLRKLYQSEIYIARPQSDRTLVHDPLT